MRGCLPHALLLLLLVLGSSQPAEAAQGVGQTVYTATGTVGFPVPGGTSTLQSSGTLAQVACSGCAATNTQQTFAGYIYVASSSALYLGLSSNGPARLFFGGSSSPTVDQGATTSYVYYPLPAGYTQFQVQYINQRGLTR
ncbi:hypothetical protein N2152v2_011226, partial [Parachlorella kessleri]